MENGDIGDVILVRCYSQDPISIIEGTLEYAPRSGGQFIDMSIHDFDLIRWLTGSEVKELWATGGCYEFKQYKDWDDGDNVSGLMKMENDAMAFFFAGRAAAHGSHVETEIVGTRGTLRIASVPTDSLVEVMSQHGVCRECYQDFITRLHHRDRGVLRLRSNRPQGYSGRDRQSHGSLYLSYPAGYVTGFAHTARWYPRSFRCRPTSPP